MKCNLAVWDRTLRFIFGVLLCIYFIIGGPFWSALGFYLLITSAWGVCPAYAFFRIRTIKEKVKPRLF
ncbi:MAG: DUF2892 domain-containing protein [Bdellovibrionaceae bacterium]|nr:DUF2892 domain-containing protein [Pseudobdellovibrionaceae bacterium]